MERLNNIFTRGGQRRLQPSQTTDRRSPESSVPSGQQARPLPPRRPLPEQGARHGQQAVQSYKQQNSQNLPPPVRSVQMGVGRSAPAPRPPYSRQHSQSSEPAAYQQQNSLPEQDYPQPRTREHYYEVDAHRGTPYADVGDEWEEDTTGIRYGDWEGDDGEESSDEHWSSEENFGDADVQPRPKVERFVPVSRPLPTRELSPRSERQTHPTRNLRDLRMPAPQPPAPQVPSQETRHPHRMTQPLNPQAIAHINSEVPQEASRLSLPARQLAVHEQAAVSVPQNAPVTPAAICPICKGAGYLRVNVPFGHPNFGKPIPCECKEAERKEKRRRQLREMSNLDAFRDKSFKNFNPRVPGVQEAYQVAVEYAKNPQGWLLFMGRNGCGKTHLAAAIANQNLTRGSLVLFSIVPELLDHLRATFAPNSTVVYDQVFSTMREAELLVLDDLGSEQNSPWATEKLFQLLNYRYNSRFPTVITTNNIRLQSVDERIRSRLMDKSLVIEVTFDRAYDYRPHNPVRE